MGQQDKNGIRGQGTRKAGQGMNWIRLSTRMAIYHRDSFCCVYCGAGAEDHGVGLTLDHLVPCELGGGNSPSNLVTACGHCNSSKQDKTKAAFLASMDAQGIDSKKIGRRIRTLVAKKLNRQEGRRLAEARKARCSVKGQS